MSAHLKSPFCARAVQAHFAAEFAAGTCLLSAWARNSYETIISVKALLGWQLLCLQLSSAPLGFSCAAAMLAHFDPGIAAGCCLLSGWARDSLETIISVTALLGMATGMPASVRTMVRITSILTTVPCRTVLPLWVLSSTLSVGKTTQVSICDFPFTISSQPTT